MINQTTLYYTLIYTALDSTMDEWHADCNCYTVFSRRHTLLSGKS